MKKLFCTLLIAFSMFAAVNVCHAETILGDAIYTDVTTYINHVPIESYFFNGSTLIAAEDLRYFGFDVVWNEYKETLTISRNSNYDIDIPYVFAPSEEQLWQKALTVTTTNVRVYTGNYQYAAFGGIDGYTLINVDDLTCFDGVTINWVPEVRALKIWVEGLYMNPFMMRTVPYVLCWEHYEAPEYSYYWDWIDGQYGFNLHFYMKTDDGNYINNDYGKLVIADVIDADGKSILKKKKICEEYDGMSLYPYILTSTEGVLSLHACLVPEDIYPRTAYEDGGIIKCYYAEDGYNPTYTFSVRVNHLPYDILYL